MAETKQRVTCKRDFSDVASTEESDKQQPKRKKRRIDHKNDNEKDNDTQKWKCSQCTLINQPNSNKCAVCNLPKNYNDDEDDEYIDNDDDIFTNTNNNKLKRNDSSVSWGDDDDAEDVDVDNFDGQQILSLNNKDIAIRTHSNKSSFVDRSHNLKESTINGLQYTECWLCTACYAMNRLLDTLSKHNMKCGVCLQATYTPKTEIIKSFEWDQNHNQQQQGGSDKLSQREMFDEYEKQKANRYNTLKVRDNKEGDILIMGMIHQNDVITLSTIKLVPEEVIRLTLLFHGDFEHDGWDTFTNTDDFNINGGLTVCTRTKKHDGFWRNCFGMRLIKYMGETQRFQWKLKVNKRKNKDWEDELVESIIIGIIEAEGIKTNMGSSFTSYKDGYGLFGDGQKVNHGEYIKFGAGFHHLCDVVVNLQFVKNPFNLHPKCQLLFGNKKAFDLNPEKGYKLAVAMKSTEYELKWTSFSKYLQPIETV